MKFKGSYRKSGLIVFGIMFISGIFFNACNSKDKKSDSNLVLIDGKDIRRRKVNMMHLEPLPLILDISKGDDTAKVIEALEKEKLC